MPLVDMCVMRRRKITETRCRPGRRCWGDVCVYKDYTMNKNIPMSRVIPSA